MGYKVDVWAGDLHQEHCASAEFIRWLDAEAYMLMNVDAGLLCNILHTDFIAPPERVAEQQEALKKTLDAG